MISASMTFLSCWEPMVRASVIRLSMRRGLPCGKLSAAASAAQSMVVAAVSYKNLTPPTTYLVVHTLVAGALKKKNSNTQTNNTANM